MTARSVYLVVQLGQVNSYSIGSFWQFGLMGVFHGVVVTHQRSCGAAGPILQALF